MPKELVTAVEVSQAIVHRITTGQYAPADRLPTVRELAHELGANRNTIHKAYQMLLELGVIESSSSGRRGFQVRNVAQVNQKTRSDLLDYYHQQSVNLVWQGMAAGISAEEMLSQLAAAVHEVYGQHEVRLAFFECNEQDSREMGRNLNQALGMPIVSAILDDLYSDLPAVFRRYDLIITTFHHLAEVMGAVKRYGNAADGLAAKKVVGIDTRPTPEAMLKIARLARTCIGLVCHVQNTAHMLEHIIYSYHPDWEVQAITLDEVNAVKDLARSCEALVVTHSCAAEVIELTGRTPDVVVNFQIDEQSILFLRQRIYEIQMSKTAALSAAPPLDPTLPASAQPEGLLSLQQS